MNNKELIVHTILTVLLAAFAIVAIAQATPAETTQEATTCPAIEETTEAVTEPIETEAPTEESTEPTEAEPTETIPLYDVPLEEELQLHIIETAEEKGIDPAIIFAMAYRESSYNPSAIGDSGNSLGLCQVQPRWHSKRMEKLDCPNLLDPYQNVTVAVDYLSELLNRYGSLDKALTAYNRGSYSGTVTEYAKTIIEVAKEL